MIRLISVFPANVLDYVIMYLFAIIYWLLCSRKQNNFFFFPAQIPELVRYFRHFRKIQMFVVQSIGLFSGFALMFILVLVEEKLHFWHPQPTIRLVFPTAKLFCVTLIRKLWTDIFVGFISHDRTITLCFVVVFASLFVCFTFLCCFSLFFRLTRSLTRCSLSAWLMQLHISWCSQLLQSWYRNKGRGVGSVGILAFAVRKAW